VPAACRSLTLLALVAALAGCGGSKPKEPPALLFVSTKDGDYAIFGADAQGKHERRLTKEKGDPSTPEGLYFETEPAWSPDGAQIAFSSRRDGTAHIYVMRADGKDARRLTSTAKTDDHPSWSADGKRIVFAREGALFVVPAGGGAVRRVGRGFGNAADPAWSPDGKLIAYDYRMPGTPVRELYVMRADGTHPRALTKLGNVSAAPAWSPDGKRLSFQSNARLGLFEIYTIGVDAKGLREVTQAVEDAFESAWSPDGSRLAYSLQGAIWVDVDGTQTQLTSGKNNDSSPAWRPTVPQ
jgi:Tol biopolymer transport system component